MKITIEKNQNIISIQREDSSIEEVMDSFISCLYLLDYDSNEIKKQIIKTAEILKNNHNEPNQNSSPI
jgi:hypothetical protein